VSPPTQRVAWGAPRVLTPRAVGPGEARGAASGATLTMRFDALGIDAQGAAAPLADASVASVLVPLTSPPGARRVRLTARLRGAVVKTAGSRVVILLATDAEVRTVELPAGRAAEEPFYRKLVAECPVQRDGFCVATLCLHGVRATTADSVVASIDSLDVRVEAAPVPSEAEGVASP